MNMKKLFLLNFPYLLFVYPRTDSRYLTSNMV